MTHALLLALALSADPTPAKLTARDQARKGLELVQRSFEAGAATLEQVCLWSRRVRDATPRSAAEDQAYLKRTRSLLEQVQSRVKKGMAPPLDVVTVEYELAEGEAEADAAGH